MPQKRWEQVYNELQRESERLGYNPPRQIGGPQSQVFEYSSKAGPVLLLAFRDLAQKPDYAAPNTLWAEGLDLVLERFQELARLGKRTPQAAAIVIDNKVGKYVVVMINELIDLYRQKGAPASPDGSRRFTFVVIREEDGYSLQMPFGRQPLALTSVDSVSSLTLLLKASKAPRP